MTSTTTAIELATGSASSHAGNLRSSSGRKNEAFERVTVADHVLEASREADSTVPEGGYGWAIVAGGFVLLWWSLGTTYAWGVMQTALVADGLADPAVLSFVGSLQAALISALAIVNSLVVRKTGVRAAAMLGAACMGGSEILSSFTVHSVGALFFTSGIVMGMGVSLCFAVISTVPSQYFSAKRGLANGFMFAGSGFGGAAISFALDSLIRKLGTAWAYRILGLMTLATGLPAAWLMKERVPVERRGFIEWKLFKSPTFVLIFVGSAIGTFPLFVPPFFLPLYTRSLGFTPNVGAGLVAGFSLSSAAGRILSGFASDKVGSINTVLVSLVLTAITFLAIWPTSTELGPLIAFVVINGAANGAFFSTMPTAISKVFGSARVAIAMSMVVTGWVGGYLLGAPIAGYILEAFGGTDGGLHAYRPAMFYAGALALVSGIFILAARFYINKSPLAVV
ncbi:major facilitator superfamily transporter [Trichoderma gamsii]|uniref:Major facilitator superfamily transporter n=2 Tax=Trichoderma gamsii TaxID=398673 RepID=A0A2P4ZQP4_9HYPO|nr:major facilitator superfamily transporter [Trichoderma gamsii]PON26629.1 major facilitator superfamily transporter [Trichoderma gamsii]